MSTQIIELAIRTPKSGITESDFIAAKDAAVKALVSLKGIGPEREFAPFTTVPATAEKPFVGMTRYETQGKTRRAMMSPRVLFKMLPFFGKMTPLTGIYLKPDDPNFNYADFATKPNVVEIALLKPKIGRADSDFLAARQTFLANLSSEPEVVNTYTFQVTGGFKNTGAFPHLVVYRDRAAFDQLSVRRDETTYSQSFANNFEADLITVCNVIK